MHVLRRTRDHPRDQQKAEDREGEEKVYALIRI